MKGKFFEPKLINEKKSIDLIYFTNYAYLSLVLSINWI